MIIATLWQGRDNVMAWCYDLCWMPCSCQVSLSSGSGEAQTSKASLMAGGGGRLWLLARAENDRCVEQAGHILGVPSLVRRRYAADVPGRDLEAGRCGGAGWIWMLALLELFGLCPSAMVWPMIEVA